MDQTLDELTKESIIQFLFLSTTICCQSSAAEEKQMVITNRLVRTALILL